MSPAASRPSACAAPGPPITVPPLPKEVSGVPSGLNRTRTTLEWPVRPSVPMAPPATILPSGWTTAALNISKPVEAGGHVQGHQALAPEGLVRGAADGEPLDGEVGEVAPAGGVRGAAHPEDLAVGLDRQVGCGYRAAREADRRAAARPEGRVQAPVGKQAHHARVAADQDVAGADHDHRAGSAQRVLARGGQAHVGDRRPVVAEAGVDAAGGAARSERGLGKAGGDERGGDHRRRRQDAFHGHGGSLLCNRPRGAGRGVRRNHGAEFLTVQIPACDRGHNSGAERAKNADAPPRAGALPARPGCLRCGGGHSQVLEQSTSAARV